MEETYFLSTPNAMMPISRERKHTHHQCPIKSLLILHEALKSNPILFSFMVQPKFLDILFNFCDYRLYAFHISKCPISSVLLWHILPRAQGSALFWYLPLYTETSWVRATGLQIFYLLFFGLFSIYIYGRIFSFKWKTSVIRVQRREGEFLKTHLPKNVFLFYITPDSLYSMEFWEHKFSKVSHWFLDF